MSDNTEPQVHDEDVVAEEPQAEGSAPAESQPLADIEVPVPGVVAQEAKTVGDEELPAPREPEVQVIQETEAAQVAQPREGDSDTVNVHEVSLAMDEVITDPSSPLAVQVPDAGRGSLDLPIHALANGLPKFD